MVSIWFADQPHAAASHSHGLVGSNKATRGISCTRCAPHSLRVPLWAVQAFEISGSDLTRSTLDRGCTSEDHSSIRIIGESKGRYS